MVWSKFWQSLNFKFHKSAVSLKKSFRVKYELSFFYFYYSCEVGNGYICNLTRGHGPGVQFTYSRFLWFLFFRFFIRASFNSFLALCHNQCFWKAIAERQAACVMIAFFFLVSWQYRKTGLIHKLKCILARHFLSCRN